jgi:Rhomboid-like protein
MTRSGAGSAPPNGDRVHGNDHAEGRPSRRPRRVGIAGRRTARVVFRHLGTLRVAPVYVGLVAAVRAAMCLRAGAASRTAVVQANSTNVANLLHGRVYTLVTSAVLLEGRACLPALLALGIVLCIGELAWGHVGMVAVFLYGHIVATLLVFAGLAVGLSLHQLCQRVARIADVGPSYGAVAVLGALLVTRTLPHPARWQLTAAVLALTVTLLDGTFTDAGHLISLLLGFAAGHAQHRWAHRCRLPV